MFKKLFIIFPIAVFTSCDFIKIQPKKEVQQEVVVASVGNEKLYQSELEGVVPKGISKQDSTVLAKSYITSWARQQLFLQKAEKNISEGQSNEIEQLVKNYRQSLYINDYKERLVKQQLDTIITEEEITLYYEQNKENFKLNEELLQLKYIHFGKDFIDKKETIKKFQSDKEEDLQDLENLTINFKDYHLRDSTWIPFEEVLQKIPPFRTESKQKLLKISKFIQKEDSLGVYLVAVKDVLKRNDIAPLSYIEPNIKQLILHKRKLELIREIEKTLIDDAIKNNIFKEY
ncbi:hypothetical protein [Tenacibaculum sp. IB213877]|uniref:hypothetical protein n=1 Tax=Tenacibaculum sp. IB213877 TaxID=3097351 RepID=UPI002A5AB74A|nr:hypothetical protein [Tenacibaculum sp. IB213877]MDY0779255.1 hypothetical protein [Tenacibaculum sp. IB213877]